MAIWQYTFWISYNGKIQDLLKDLEIIFGKKVREDEKTIYFSDLETDCSIFLDNNDIFCRLSLINKKELEEKIKILKRISEKYNLKFLVWEEYVWEKEIDYKTFVEEIYKSNNMKFAKWKYKDVFKN